MLDDHLLWMIPHSAASFLPLSAALSFPLLQQQEEQQQQQPEQFQNLLPEAPAFALNSTSFENGCFMSPSCQSSYSLAFPDSSAESAGSYAIPSIASPTTNPVFTVSPAQSFSSTILDQMITGLTIDSVAAAPQLPLAAAASFPSSSPPPGVPEEAATTLLSSVVAQQLTLADGDHNIFLQPWLEQQIIVQQQENDQGHITQQQQEQGRQRPEKQPNMTDNKKSLTESKGAASGAAKGNPSPVRRTRHICPFCTHSSNRANNMKEHIMTHYPNRPKAFKCHRCGKPFARKHDMKRHLKIHERRRTPRYPGTILFC
ncbi:hypothetical protein BX666DRAFT_1142526 [Dichotomocladium elegans]|nr:hypothetical protein BX666DRAFT_1142526 [Dichotomocladium elegans]